MSHMDKEERPKPVQGIIVATDGGGSLTVDATNLPLPTGASTSAAQTDGSQKNTASGRGRGFSHYHCWGFGSY